MITRVAAVKRVPSEAAISEVLWARHEAWLSWYCAGARTSPGLSPSDAAASAAAAAAAAAACFCLLRWRSLRRRFRSDVAACSVRSCWLGTCSRTPPSSDGLDALSRSGTGSAPACAAPTRATRCRLQSKVNARRAPVLRPLLLGGSSRLISPPRASSCLLSPPLGLLSAASLLHVCCLSAACLLPLCCTSASRLYLKSRLHRLDQPLLLGRGVHRAAAAAAAELGQVLHRRVLGHEGLHHGLGVLERL